MVEPCWDAPQWSTNKKDEINIRFKIAIEMIEKIYSDLCKENPRIISREEAYEFSYLINQLITFSEVLKEQQSHKTVLSNEQISLLPDEIVNIIANNYKVIKKIEEENHNIIEQINILRKKFNDNYAKKEELNKQIESNTSGYQKKLKL